MFFMGTMEIYSPFPKCIPCLSKNKKRKRYIFSFGRSRAKGYVYILIAACLENERKCCRTKNLF